MNSKRPMTWVGHAEANPLARLLAGAFSDSSAISRTRFRIKLLTTPHLSVNKSVVIGLVPSSRWARLVCVLTWPVTGAGKPFDSLRVPLLLRRLPRSWRVVNFAASPSVRVHGRARDLGIEIIEMADIHRITLHILARTNDPRLVPAYVDHGFVKVLSRRRSSRTDDETGAALMLVRYPALETDRP